MAGHPARVVGRSGVDEDDLGPVLDEAAGPAHPDGTRADDEDAAASEVEPDERRHGARFGEVVIAPSSRAGQPGTSPATKSVRDAEDVLEADRHARVVGDGAHGRQDAGHERHPIDAVMADRQGLALCPEEDLLMGDESPQPNRVDGNAVDPRATGAARVRLGRVRYRPEVRLRPGPPR